MAQKYVAPFGKCVARRVYHSRSKRRRDSKVTVEIGTPSPVPGSDWGCRVRIRGLSEPVNRTVFGIDPVQALSIALIYSGMMVTSSEEFRDGRLHLWGSPARNVFEVALPLPMSSVQSALEQLTWVIEASKSGRKINEEWRKATLTVLRDLAKELQLRRRWNGVSESPSARSGR